MARLRMKCSSCGHWNKIPVNKIFIPQNSPEPKVKVSVRREKWLARALVCRTKGKSYCGTKKGRFGFLFDLF